MLTEEIGEATFDGDVIWDAMLVELTELYDWARWDASCFCANSSSSGDGGQ